MSPSESQVFGLLSSETPFPIDFDDAWQWVGYSRKDAAKLAFEKGGFVKDIDFSIELWKSSGGRKPEKIWLTLDSFKMFCMMAGTAKGREVRLYFLRCERQLKERIEQEQQNQKTRVLNAYIAKERLPWKKKYTEEYYEQIHRLKGWEYDHSKGRTPLLGKITNDIVYMRLQPGVLDELCRKNPVTPRGRRQYRHHQFLTDNIGNPHLRSHLSFVINVMKGCSNWNSFITLLDRFKPRPTGVQPDIFFELMETGEINFEQWEKLVS